MISVNHLSFNFSGNTIFDNFSAEFLCGKINVILGRSGTGKTTFLNMIAGTLQPTSGQINFENCEKNDPQISYVFQEARLIPSKTVFSNLDFALSGCFPDKIKRAEIINSALKDVGLLDDKNKYPSELSGGMAQRVSLARAFSFPSDIILLDEPFKGLDKKTSEEVQDIFLRLFNNERTVFFVTHNIAEALMLADKIFVFPEKPISSCAEFLIETNRAERDLFEPNLAKIKEEIFHLLD